MNSVSSASAGACAAPAAKAVSASAVSIIKGGVLGNSTLGDVSNPPGSMLANLRALFGSVVDIILFRRGPENLPASQALLAIVVALSILGSVAMSAVTALPTSNALLEGIVGSAVMLLWFR